MLIPPDHPINTGVFSPKQLQRFWGKVVIGNEHSCWEWQGGKQGRDRWLYGVVSIANVKIGAHRTSYIVHYGPIPLGTGAHGLCVCHKCDNPLCVNPSHLFLGNHNENMKDKVDKKRDTTKYKTHCIKGHERNAVNSYTSKSGLTACRVCHKLRERTRRAAQAAGG